MIGIFFFNIWWLLKEPFCWWFLKTSVVPLTIFPDSPPLVEGKILYKHKKIWYVLKCRFVHECKSNSEVTGSTNASAMGIYLVSHIRGCLNEDTFPVTVSTVFQGWCMETNVLLRPLFLGEGRGWRVLLFKNVCWLVQNLALFYFDIPPKTRNHCTGNWLFLLPCSSSD